MSLFGYGATAARPITQNLHAIMPQSERFPAKCAAVRRGKRDNATDSSAKKAAVGQRPAASYRSGHCRLLLGCLGGLGQRTRIVSKRMQVIDHVRPFAGTGMPGELHVGAWDESFRSGEELAEIVIAPFA